MLLPLPKLRWFFVGSGLIALLLLGAERAGQLLGHLVKLFDRVVAEKDPYVVYESPDDIGYRASRVSTVFDGYDTVEDLFGDGED